MRKSPKLPILQFHHTIFPALCAGFFVKIAVFSVKIQFFLSRRRFHIIFYEKIAENGFICRSEAFSVTLDTGDRFSLFCAGRYRLFSLLIVSRIFLPFVFPLTCAISPA